MVLLYHLVLRLRKFYFNEQMVRGQQFILNRGAQNPAIDLAGRIMSSCVGYPREVWSNFEYFFWVSLA